MSLNHSEKFAGQGLSNFVGTNLAEESIERLDLNGSARWEGGQGVKVNDL